MEATNEETGGLLDMILPPRVVDAGLEDCALPPDRIKEVFFKAGSAVKSRAPSFFNEDDEPDAPGQCVDYLWSRAKNATDTMVGVGPFPDVPGPCGAVKGGGVAEEGADKVVVVGGGVDYPEGDRCVVPGGEVAEGERSGGCVEGERGKDGGKEEEKRDKENEKPRLVEIYNN